MSVELSNKESKVKVMKALKLEDMQLIAAGYKGLCLSITYSNNKQKLLWQCEYGHQWLATSDSIKQGRWCRKCSYIKRGVAQRFSISDMHKTAALHGGECLSTEYIKSGLKLRWKCAKGHVWDSVANDVRQGHWCPVCAATDRARKRAFTLEDMQRFAKDREGSCLSEVYENSQSKLKWQCKEGHVWLATPTGILNSGYWCPKCAGVQKLSLPDMEKLAAERGGKCLSTEYKNSWSKLEWQCEEGHKWGMTPNSVQVGQWCPICSSGISERVCRGYFELIFSETFPKVKPLWLKNSKGNKMELDGYSEKLKLAFEYQGEQHYKEIPAFNTRSHKEQSDADEQKRKLCNERGIILIEIPYTVEITDMQRFIVNELVRVNVVVPQHPTKSPFELNGVNTRPWINKLQEIAKSREGKLLSKVYVNSTTKLEWQCKKKHTWMMKPENIVQGQWCPQCAGNVKLNIGFMRNEALKRGGECLSGVYINSASKLKWRCKEGHIWESTGNGVRQGHWCSKCAIKKRTSLRNPEGRFYSDKQH